MAIFNMVQGKVPMTYRGTKTIALFHFENNITPSVGTGTFSNFSGYATGKFGRGVIASYNTNYTDPKLAFAKNPFTVEYFEFRKTDIYGGLSLRSENNNVLLMSFGNFVDVFYMDGRVSHNSYTSVLLNNDFNHFSIAGDGGPDGRRHIAVYLNGVNVAYSAVDYNLETVSKLIVSTSPNVIDELRVSNVYRYTTNFTLPAAPFVPD